MNPPNTDYVEYNSIKTALVAIPRDFGVKLKIRDEAWLEGLMQQEPPYN
jgi:phenylacetate 2-hydroxylase